MDFSRPNRWCRRGTGNIITEFTLVGARMIFRTVFLICCASAATAGPFGLEKGMPLSAIKVVENLADNQYIIQVPQPHSMFDTYLAIISQRAGLCRVMAIGNKHERDGQGTQARFEFNEISRSLANKYGKSRNFDFIRSNSVWKANEHWAMSVYRKDRNLASAWGKEFGSSLTDDISTIMLEADADEPTRTFVTLAYDFSNLSDCQAETENANDSAL